MPGLPEIAAEASGTPLNGGCHYASTSLGEGVEVFQDAKSYVGVAPTDPGAKATLAPSLGKGAQVITEGSGSTACTVIVPSTGAAQYQSIVTTLFRHSATSDANCSAAVKALEVVANQSS